MRLQEVATVSLPIVQTTSTLPPLIESRFAAPRSKSQAAKPPVAKVQPTAAPTPVPNNTVPDDTRSINTGTSLVRVCLVEKDKTHIIVGAYVHDGWTMIVGDPNIIEDKDELQNMLKIYSITLLMGSAAWDCTSGQSAPLLDILTISMFGTSIYLLKTKPFKLDQKVSITVFTDKIHPGDDICHTFNDYCLKDRYSFVHKYLGYPTCKGEITSSKGRFNYCNDGKSSRTICANEIETVYAKHPFVFCNGLLYGYVNDNYGYILVTKFNALALHKLYQIVGRIAREVHRQVPDE